MKLGFARYALILDWTMSPRYRYKLETDWDCYLHLNRYSVQDIQALLSRIKVNQNQHIIAQENRIGQTEACPVRSVLAYLEGSSIFKLLDTGFSHMSCNRLPQLHVWRFLPDPGDLNRYMQCAHSMVRCCVVWHVMADNNISTTYNGMIWYSVV